MLDFTGQVIAHLLYIVHVMQVESLLDLGGRLHLPTVPESSHKYKEVRELAANAIAKIAAKTQELEGEVLLSRLMPGEGKKVACEHVQNNSDGTSAACSRNPVYARISTMQRIGVHKEVCPQQQTTSAAWRSVPKMCWDHYNTVLNKEEQRDFVLVRGRDHVCLNCCLQKEKEAGLCQACKSKCFSASTHPKYEALMEASVSTVLRFFPVRLLSYVSVQS